MLNTQEEMLEWLHEFNAKCEADHAARMKQWEYLNSEQYSKDLNEQLLNETHSNIKPPWEEDDDD